MVPRIIMSLDSTMMELLSFDRDARGDPVLSSAQGWRLISDTVMGGRSRGDLTVEEFAGRSCLRLRGQVSLENNGGFLQAAKDLGAGEGLDATGFEGVLLDVAGNDEDYNLHLRTAAMRLPWQSYRARFHATCGWQTVRLPFAMFQPYRVGSALDLRRLRRLGVVAIGRAFVADLRLARVAFY